jgi:Fe2+ transport system protein FeoA
MLKPLTSLNKNTKYKIVKIDTDIKIFKRLFDLGIREGEEIYIIEKSLFNSPIIIECFGILVALDETITNNIFVI